MPRWLLVLAVPLWLAATPPEAAAAPALATLSCAPVNLSTGAVTTCTVGLTEPAGPSGFTVALSSDNPALTLPGSILVPAGASSTTFAATAGQVPATTATTVRAAAGGLTRTATVVLGFVPLVGAVTCSPGMIVGSGQATCTVVLGAAALPGGADVALRSSDPRLSVPVSVRVPAGASTASFSATATAVSADTVAVITASLNGSSQTFSLLLAARFVTLSLACALGTLPPTASTVCTVALSKPAGPEGLVVALSSSHPSLLVPDQVVIPAEAMSTQFTATAGLVSSPVSVTLTATAGALRQTITLRITHLVSLVSLRCSPATILTPGQSTCLVFATGTAPSEGWTVSLTSDNPSLSVPAAVTIPGGSSGEMFLVTAEPVAAGSRATISATLNGGIEQFSLTLAAGAVPGALRCEPALVASGGAATCTVVLTQAAGPEGSTILLASSDPALVVPASVTANAGQAAATFRALAGSVAADTVVTITATIGGLASSASLTIQHSAPVAEEEQEGKCVPATLPTPGSSSCTVRLTQPAPAGGSTVKLTSSHKKLTVPDSITVPAGATTATFLARAAAVTADTAAVITATAGPEIQRFALWLTGTRPVALACTPKTVNAGERASCELRLNSAESGAPLTLAVTSSSQHAVVPKTIVTRPGQASLSFQVLIGPSSPQQSVTITVTYEDVSVRDTITILPAAAPVLTVPGPQVVAAGQPLRFKVSAVDPGGLPVFLSAAQLPAGATFDAVAGEFAWTPQLTQLGSYRISFLATNTLNVAGRREVAVDVVSGRMTISALVNAASLSSELVCSPGALASVFGSGFTAGSAQRFSGLRAPTELNGVRVRVNQEYAPVLYVSDKQVNFLCPSAAPGSRLSVVVESASDRSNSVELGAHYAAPGIFTLDGSGQGQGTVLLAGTDLLVMPRNGLVAGQPAQPEDLISIFATGLGPVDGPPAWGEAAPLDRLVPVQAPVRVTIGGLPAEVSFAGLAPGEIALFRVDVKVPRAAPLGEAVPVALAITDPSGRVLASNTVTIAIEPKPE